MRRDARAKGERGGRIEGRKETVRQRDMLPISHGKTVHITLKVSDHLCFGARRWPRVANSECGYGRGSVYPTTSRNGLAAGKRSRRGGEEGWGGGQKERDGVR